MTEPARQGLGDSLECLKDLVGRIEFYPFQINTARKVLWQFGSKAIIADEVGLGKTIEAGLVLKELVTRGSITSALVLVPKAIEQQWQLELIEKFDEAFSRFSEVSTARLSDSSFGLKLIAGHSLMSHEQTFRHLASRTWDLVIVDEAHRFSSGTSNMGRNLKKLATQRILLLTATPLQNSLSELFELISIVRPDLGRAALDWKTFVFDSQGRIPRGSRLGEMRAVLDTAMCRTRRSEAGIEFVPRIVESLSVQPSEFEHQLIEGTYRLFRALSAHGATLGNSRLARLSILQSLSSHPVALQQSLSSLFPAGEGVPELVTELQRMTVKARPSAKEAALARILEKNQSSQAVIFVERLATGHYLRERLSEDIGPAAFYHGGLSSEDRTKVVQQFRTGTTRFFLSTSAGAEGLNLQNASLLVNFDLHWNPLRLEQRIGRVHRFGQRRPVTVINLTTQGTVDDLVKAILYDKIDLFRLAIGEIEAILAQFGDDFDLEASIEDIVLSAEEPTDLERRLTHLQLEVKSRMTEQARSRSFSDSILDQGVPQH